MYIKGASKKINKDLQLELKLIFRGVSLWVVVAIWFILLVLFTISVPSAWRTGNAFTTSAWVTQTLLTCGMIFGTIRSSSERKAACIELLSSVSHARMIRICSKILAVLLLGLFVFVTGSISICLYFIKHEITKAYYLPSIAYIALYWSLPLVTAGALGCFFGSAIRSKLVYPVVFAFSFVLGPLIPKMTAPFLLGSGGTLYQYYSMFNIGQLETDSMMLEAYGYCLNAELWAVRISVLIGALIFGIYPALCYGKRKIFKVPFVFVAIGFFALGFTGANQILKIQYNRYQDAVMERYYKENPEPQFSVSISDINSAYEIEEYSIELDDGLALKISTEIAVSIRDADIPMVYTLYHGFDVKKCRFDGVSMEFTRAGDALILGGSEYRSGQHTIYLEYEGRPPMNLYKAGDKWVLPGMFAWIPVEYVGKAMENENMSTALFNYPGDKKDVPISLVYKGTHKVFCSLSETEDDFWKGTSSGVTICSGWFDEKDVNGISVVYPMLYEQNPEQAVNLMMNLKKEIPVVSEEMLDEKKEMNAKKIFVFPSILQNNLGNALYTLSDHVIACIYFDQGGFLIEQADGITLIENLLKTGGWAYADFDMVHLFERLYLDNLKNRGILKTGYEPNIESLINTLENKRKNIAGLAKKMVQYLRIADKKEQIRFFRKYLDLINSGATVNEVISVLSILME